ncbi:MAG: hypothetical protein QME51_01670 [Planctomycetota bacterium]|nr:hypothetical protein [Planctomycetota bacterium]MDI6787062.1 hypothetical protein [Planctomycetota bacterium]
MTMTLSARPRKHSGFGGKFHIIIFLTLLIFTPLLLAVRPLVVTASYPDEYRDYRLLISDETTSPLRSLASSPPPPRRASLAKGGRRSGRLSEARLSAHNYTGLLEPLQDKLRELQPSIVGSNSSRSAGLKLPYYGFSLTQWQTEGDFRMHGGPPNANNTWELKHPIDSNITQLLFSIRPEEPDSPFLLNIALGTGRIKKGTIRDTDWDGNGVVSHLSYSISQGNTDHISLSFNYRQTDRDEPYELNLVLSYNYTKISANYIDPIIVVSDYVPTYIAIPSYKWNTYNLLYNGLEIGIKGESYILENVLLSAGAGYTPSLRAEYRGKRYPDTIYEKKEHIIATGSGLNYEINLSYELAKEFYIQGGYRANIFRTKGEDQRDSAWAGSWEELDADFKGFSYGILFRF